MKKRNVLVLMVTLLLLLFALPASGAQTSTEQQTALEISKLINAYRAEKGMYQYLYNDTLAAVAQTHTDYQVSINLSTHEGQGGSTSKERVTASGYGNGGYLFVDEMIYSGQSATPQVAVEWWKNSPIHNAIMLSDKYHEIGVGVRITETRKYYTVNVASIRDVTSPGVGSAPVEVAPEVAAPSAVTPVTVALPEQDGSIFHIVEQGQTLPQIADAYQVSLDTLLVNNNLASGSELTPGQLLIVRMPENDVSAPEVDSQIAPPSAEEAVLEPAPVAAPNQDIQPAVPEGYMLIPNVLLTVLVVVAVVASAGVTFFAYLRLADSGRRRR